MYLRAAYSYSSVHYTHGTWRLQITPPQESESMTIFIVISCMHVQCNNYMLYFYASNNQILYCKLSVYLPLVYIPFF